MLAIKVENLSKQYRLGQIGTGTISHDLNRFWASIRGKEDPYSQIGSANDRTQKAVSDYVWALKDINFEIEQGDAVGIIGRNGAGKSTLLKILSRTTLPTTGSVKMKGRIASLLEVGTGFHPEMTGRENIYQNGAILGMTRHEITRKFDEIVDFSGCEAYIDTPVKRYSSGMYVRLAFAVAAHLESEILIVDEVLAVGDAEFQKKCLGKMNDVAKGEGRTVLFVSHNMGAVSNFCNKGMLLESGMLTFESYNLNKVIAKYIESSNSIKSYWFLSEDKPLNSNEYFNPKAIYLVSKSGEKNKSVFSNNEEVGVIIEGELIEKSSLLSIGFALYTNNNELLYWSLNTDQIVNDTPDIKIGNNKLICWLPKHFLNEGIYQIHLLIGLHFVRSLFEPQKNSPYITFEIKGGLSFSPYWHTARPGLLAPLLTFKQI